MVQHASPRLPVRLARRSTHTPMPVAWAALVHERCGCAQRLTWDAWQAVSSSLWSAAKALSQQFLLFQRCPETGHDLLRHGVSPQSMIALCENLRREGLLSPTEAATLEETILTQTTKVGTWKEKSYGTDANHLPQE